MMMTEQGGQWQNRGTMTKKGDDDRPGTVVARNKVQ